MIINKLFAPIRSKYKVLNADIIIRKPIEVFNFDVQVENVSVLFKEMNNCF